MDKEKALKIWLPVIADGVKDLPECKESLEMAIEALENQKTGHWIELWYAGNDNYDFKCSECNHSDIHSKIVKVPYCWYCGAKMEGENNEDSN